MSDNPLDRIPDFDRVSIRAVIVEDGEDPAKALSEAGIVDPVAVAVVFGADQPDNSFGDGITPNLTAVLEFEQQDDQQKNDPGRPPDEQAPNRIKQFLSGTASPQPDFWAKPVAPVRQRDN